MSEQPPKPKPRPWPWGNRLLAFALIVAVLAFLRFGSC